MVFGCDEIVAGSDQFSRAHTEGAGIFPRKVVPTGRKFFLGGNWKCNGTQDSIKKLVDDLNEVEFEEDVEIVVCPPFLYIHQVLETLTKRIDVAAQNCWTGKGGAITGEICADQLVDVGVKWVVLGHAERRHFMGETNSMVSRKAAYALSRGLGVIITVGDRISQTALCATSFKRWSAKSRTGSKWCWLMNPYGLLVLANHALPSKRKRFTFLCVSGLERISRRMWPPT